MKKLLFFLLFLPIIGISQSWNDLKQATKKINKEILQQNAFSEKEARSAIK